MGQIMSFGKPLLFRDTYPSAKLQKKSWNSRHLVREKFFTFIKKILYWKALFNKQPHVY